MEEVGASAIIRVDIPVGRFAGISRIPAISRRSTTAGKYAILLRRLLAAGYCYASICGLEAATRAILKPHRRSTRAVANIDKLAPH